MKNEYMNMNDPIEIWAHLMQQIHNYKYNDEFEKNYIHETLDHLMESIEKSKYKNEFFRLFREGKEFFDYIEYKDTDLHRTDKRHLDNLDEDIQRLIDEHRDNNDIGCSLLEYVTQNLSDYTYYIRKYYDSGEIYRRVMEYFEANDIE